MNRIGRFNVLRRLAAGDVAEVFACRREDTQVAVELFRPKRSAIVRISTLPPDVVLERLCRRFRDEAELMARFEHPNIVSVLEIGALDPGTPYYVMPYYPASLASEVWQSPPPDRDPAIPLPRRAAKALPPDVALRRLRDILAGLAAVHADGVAHRDLKPKNVLVGSSGGAAISDFGVAKVPWPGYTPLRPAFGTPPFVSPEQLDRSGAADARSDVYAVGAIAYFIFTGELPGADISAGRLNSLVSAPLSAWIINALHPNPDERAQTAAILLRRLNEFMPGQERPD